MTAHGFNDGFAARRDATLRLPEGTTSSVGGSLRAPHQGTVRPSGSLPGRRARSGVTLVELLVTISIIGILMSAMLLAMAAASEAASEAKTRTTIAKLNALLIEQWDTYRTRRVPFVTRDITPLEPHQNMLMRLNGIRVLMQMDFPDRWTEVTTSPQRFNNPKKYSIGRTALSSAYLRRFNDLRQQDPKWPSRDYENAECLYLIITIATGDGEALAQFRDDEIGDFDGDGAPEFLDGWGNPIRFLRWPAGTVSELQPLIVGGTDLLADRNVTEKHDPFDPFRQQPEAFVLYPLIFSAGPDGGFDVLGDAPREKPGFTYPYEPIDSVPVLNPYVVEQESGMPIGWHWDLTGDGDEFHDNIHNHLIGLR